MRLGGYFLAESMYELESLCESLDTYGLSAIRAPTRLAEMTREECLEFGLRARNLDIVIGESGMWENLLTSDPDLQAARIQQVRTLLRNADAMGCRCVATLIGSKDPSDHPLAPHPYLYTDECKAEFREIVLRILDGLDLQTTRYVIEPWHNTFFYQPEEIRAFLDSVDHPSLGLHLDQMNMVSQSTFYDTTSLINTTFDLLADRVVSVHFKDVACDFDHMFLKWDEVYVGDGVMDYVTYLRRCAELPSDTPSFCEHMADEQDFALNFARLHYRADQAGMRFVRRKEQ